MRTEAFNVNVILYHPPLDCLMAGVLQPLSSNLRPRTSMNPTETCLCWLCVNRLIILRSTVTILLFEWVRGSSLTLHTWLLPRVPQCRCAVSMKHNPREGTAHGGSAREGRKGDAREGSAPLGVITQLQSCRGSPFGARWVLLGALNASPHQEKQREDGLAISTAATTAFLADSRSWTTPYAMAPNGNVQKTSHQVTRFDGPANLTTGESRS